MWSEWMARTLKLRPGADAVEVTRVAANPPPQPSPSRGGGGFMRKLAHPLPP
jgi:hypothetical protein